MSATIWLTGLSSAGKTTIAKSLAVRLRRMGYRVEVLDGDEVRKHLSPDLGFTREDRDENIRRMGYLACLLNRNKVYVIGAAISPYREARKKLREHIFNFCEVFVDCPLPVCVQRDVKGLYKKALQGEIQGFTGVDDPYEPPLDPEVVLDTSKQSVDECCERILGSVRKKGYL